MKPILFRLFPFCFILTAFAACKSESRPKQIQKAISIALATTDRDHLCGEWRDSRYLWLDYRLTLYPDSSFDFYQITCIRPVFSKGKWEIKGRTLYLTSFESFRTAVKASRSEDTTGNESALNSSCNQVYTIDTTVCTASVKIDDTEKTYFNNLNFHIENDTLIPSVDSGYLSSTRFYK